MKTFQQYLVESARTYDYRIKVVGDVPAGFFDQLKDRLSQFDVAKMTKPGSCQNYVQQGSFSFL